METRALRHFMGAYLHQDFDLVGSVEDNLALFVRQSPALAAALSDEVADLLAHPFTDGELERLLDEMGCEASPPVGKTYRDWLTQIADRVRRTTA
ncbi:MULTISPECIES: contact-dependent growth inhibition system immunity protein [unclassified Nocardioides]|uniref:contact-dependent growth inhibition system immunity protein n=1 Tax=unclassified Nocardioides TaxID=2615069 RepID=UPI0000570C21|nr:MULTISPECIES: contact-dependent growth inhibition system immunity protein [unclassified Nocardioides]ABL83232.1 hypothetical protein Noca_3732 [Nocardioides sp. JS614]